MAKRTVFLLPIDIVLKLRIRSLKVFDSLLIKYVYKKDSYLLSFRLTVSK